MLLDGAPPYEQELIEIMMYDQVSLGQALELDMIANHIDISDVYDMVDYLELKLEELDKVEYYMAVFMGQLPDVGLKLS